MISKLTGGLSIYGFNLSNAPSGVSKSLGTEVDLSAAWKHSENVSFTGTIGTFAPGKLIKDTNDAAHKTTNAAMLAALDVSVKF